MDENIATQELVWPPQLQDYLSRFYASYNLETIEQKIKFLVALSILERNFTVIPFAGTSINSPDLGEIVINNKQRLCLLEMHFLRVKGLISLPEH